VPVQATQPSKSSPKKKRSLKRPDPKKHNVNPSRVLPIDIDQSELTGIMERIATGQEQDPNAAFSKIYVLALEAIADTIKGALTSLVGNLQSIPQSEIPPFLAGLIPSRDPKTLEAVKHSLAEKIDLSREKLQQALSKQAKARQTAGNYTSFANQVRERGFVAPIHEAVEKGVTAASNKLLPNHVTADRLREICDDIKQYKPAKSTHDTFKIDLSRLPERETIRFSTKKDVAPNQAPQAETLTSSVELSCPSDDAVSADNAEVQLSSEVKLSSVAQDDVQTSVEVSAVEDVKSEIAANEVEQNEILSNELAQDEVVDQVRSEGPLKDVVEQVPTVLEQALLSAAIANQVQPGTLNNLPQIESQAADTLKTFGVEVIQTFDGITNMMSDFAAQLASAIIEDQANRLPTLSEALENDPRMEDDQELKDFVSFLDSSEEGESDTELDNDELAAAFGSLLDMLDD